MYPPPPLTPFRPEGIFQAEGVCVYFEAPRGRNFISPPFFYTPPRENLSSCRDRVVLLEDMSLCLITETDSQESGENITHHRYELSAFLT